MGVFQVILGVEFLKLSFVVTIKMMLYIPRNHTHFFCMFCEEVCVIIEKTCVCI
uniref:Uncharacterized protein n=1 Tax=viral metagenome TaxID=1070528 RepID=A0A6C0E0E9_9ZZZZ